MASSTLPNLTNLATPQPTMLMYAALSPFGATDDRKITANSLLATITANISDISVQFDDGAATATVSSAGKGKLRYNDTTKTFQVSVDGGAYVSLDTGTLAGVPVNINVDTSAVGNVGGGLDNLHSFTLPAGSLAADDDYLTVRYSGTFAANDNDKRIVISFGGQTVNDTGLFDQDQFNWGYIINYVRVNDTTVRAMLMDTWGFINRDGAGGMAGNGLVAVANIDLTVSDLDTNNQTLLVQAEGTANNDIVQNLSLIELIQL